MVRTFLAFAVFPAYIIPAKVLPKWSRLRRDKLHWQTEPKWRNWQTRRTQNPVRLTPGEGSSPSFGTTSMETKPYVVYLLRSLKDYELYKAMTDNLVRRLKDHERGRVPSTKHRRPLVFLYSESFATRAEARQREKFFKSGPGHKLLMSLISSGPELADASR